MECKRFWLMGRRCPVSEGVSTRRRRCVNCGAPGNAGGGELANGCAGVVWAALPRCLRLPIPGRAAIAATAARAANCAVAQNRPITRTCSCGNMRTTGPRASKSKPTNATSSACTSWDSYCDFAIAKTTALRLQVFRHRHKILGNVEENVGLMQHGLEH